MVTFNQQGFPQICPRRYDGNGHIPNQQGFQQSALPELETGTAVTEGMLSFEAIKWRMTTLNQLFLFVLNL